MNTTLPLFEVDQVMKFRDNTEAQKIEPQMAPMIDIVFQLLIFFMLTLKIVEPEGDFSINMPVAAQAPPQENPDPETVIKVRLKANKEGRLQALELRRRSLGNDARAFERLNAEILQIIGRPDNPITKDFEVEIDADFNLNYGYTVKAISACTGRLDPNSKTLVRYIEKIKFAPPREPDEG